MLTVDVQGVSIPALGYGTWQLNGDACERGVAYALEVGYRHIDTAQMYGNEDRVGRGLKASGVDRDDVFLTTKIDNHNHAPGDVRRSTEESLRKLDTDRVDLLLIHWPVEMEQIDATLTAMAQLQDDDKVSYLGVSNFTPTQLRHALDLAPLITNQVEYHPFLGQPRLLELVAERDLALTAYSPLARGRVFADEVLKDIAAAHDATPGQVALRWLLQQDRVAAIPKATSPEHIDANLRALDLQLTDDEMERIFDIGRQERILDPPFGPAWEQ